MIELLELHDLDTHHARLWTNIYFALNGWSYVGVHKFGSEVEAKDHADTILDIAMPHQGIGFKCGTIMPRWMIKRHMQIPVLG